MQSHDSHDLDDVIDDVARAMTSARLERDLRPAIAERLVGVPSWSFGWRVSMAAAALGVIVVAAVVSRPGGEPQQTRLAARPDVRPVVAMPEEPRIASGPSASEPQPVRPEKRVARQTIVHTAGTEDVVVIDPMAIVPLEADDVISAARDARQVVTIAPIDVEPVRFSALGEQIE